jgi:hypothetical protein
LEYTFWQQMQGEHIDNLDPTGWGPVTPPSRSPQPRLVAFSPMIRLGTDEPILSLTSLVDLARREHGESLSKNKEADSNKLDVGKFCCGILHSVVMPSAMLYCAYCHNPAPKSMIA